MNNIDAPDTSRATLAETMREGALAVLVRIPDHTLTRAQAIALCSSADITEHLADVVGDRAAARCFHVVHAVEHAETYIYILGGTSTHALAVERLRKTVQALYPTADVTSLEVCQVVPGASAGLAGAWHYVVETDVKPQAENDFNDWYQNEHLPGLASVPGTVLAVRLKNPQGSPRYHACYLLHTREAFGSEPWLAVRATDWASQVRPNFMNTKRTMFTVAG